MLNNTQYLTGGKSPNPLSPPTNFVANAGNAQVTLTWNDPPNATAEPSGQTIATWAYTQVVRKEGSQPAGPSDGTVIVTSSTRDQYAINGYLDTGLTNNTQYYYGAFAYNSDGVVSEGSFASATPVAGVPLSSFSEGDIIKIQENGVPVEFYVANLNYEPTLNFPGRVLMVRKDVYDQRAWNSPDISTWATSLILSWLNGDYKNLFSSNVQQLMGETKYQYTLGNENTTLTTRSDSVFLLSLRELGKTASYSNNEGTVLPIANTLEIAYANGIATSQWTRSPNANYNYVVFYLSHIGSVENGSCNYGNGSRPCFTLPSETLIDPDGVLIEGQPIPEQKAPLSALAEGTLITINESGAPVEFYVACQNYESELNGEGRVLCVRKDVYDQRQWNSTNVNAWATSTMLSWLNGDYKGLFSSNVQEWMAETKYNSNYQEFLSSVFLCSFTELGLSNSSATIEGYELPIANTLKISYENGAATIQWTRTKYKGNSSQVWTITSAGYGSNPSCTVSCGSRPCFTLPSTAYVDANLALIETA